MSLSQRFERLDGLRGIAVVAMIAFHFLFDLNTYCQDFVGGPLPLHPWFWPITAGFIGATFFFTVGFSFHISLPVAPTPFTRKRLKRGAQILACAALITLLTAKFNPEMPIYFGILHCIGAAYFLSYLFIRKPRLTLAAALAIFAIGAYCYAFPLPWASALAFGFTLEAGRMGDYYPLAPWLGFVLIGIYAAQTRFANLLIEGNVTQRVGRALAFLGRHSLLIYLVHQPVMLALLYLAGIARLH